MAIAPSSRTTCTTMLVPTGVSAAMRNWINVLVQLSTIARRLLTDTKPDPCAKPNQLPVMKIVVSVSYCSTLGGSKPLITGFGIGVFVGNGVLVGVGVIVGVEVIVGVVVAVSVAVAVSVGGPAVALGGTGVSVGTTAVFVGTAGVPVPVPAVGVGVGRLIARSMILAPCRAWRCCRAGTPGSRCRSRSRRSRPCWRPFR